MVYVRMDMHGIVIMAVGEYFVVTPIGLHSWVLGARFKGMIGKPKEEINRKSFGETD